MNRGIFTIKLILLMIAMLSCNAFCYTLEASELNRMVLSQLNKEAQTHLTGKDYKVSISQIPTYSIETNENVKPKVEVVSLNKDFSLISFKKVLVKNSKNETLKTIPINVHIKLYEDVLVALENIAFGAEIDAKNTKIERKEVSKMYGKTLSSLEEGNFVASRSIVSGSVILSNYVKLKPLVTKNSDIDIVFKSNNGLIIAVKGKALKGGGLGEKILVKSDKYNKIYNATVETQSSVVVKI